MNDELTIKIEFPFFSVNYSLNIDVGMRQVLSMTLNARNIFS